MGAFPGGYRLTEGGVQRRQRGDAELGTHKGKALVIRGQVSRAVPVRQVQQDGIGEIEGIGFRQPKDCRDLGRVKVEEGNGAGGDLSELLCGEDRVFSVDPGQDALGFKEHPA